MNSSPGGPPAEPHLLTTFHVRRASTGDPSSLRWVVERFTPLLLAQARYRLGGALASICDPEDVVQEVWIRTLPKLEELTDTDRRATPRVVQFLSTAVLNHINNLLMRQLRRRTSVESDRSQALPDVPDPAAGAVTMALRGEAHDRILAAIESLARDDREIVILRAIEQRDNAKVAEQLGIAPNTAAVRFRRALARLRDQLPKSVFDELDDQAESAA